LPIEHTSSFATAFEVNRAQQRESALRTITKAVKFVAIFDHFRMKVASSWVSIFVTLVGITLVKTTQTNEPLVESSLQREAKEITYMPGKAVVHENGLVLSQGLASRLIAQSGERVVLANGDRSDDVFHELPDGAAVFLDPKSSNYKYVSNSESRHHGGVGSITFDKDGKVIGYDRLLSGTEMNCGGGKTFWNTWLTCEEHDDGQIWEVNPFSGKSKRTELGRGYSAPYESAAYDNRNVNRPTFYATIDREDGPLLKFTPPAAAVQQARASGDYSNLLHTSTDDESAYEYLVLGDKTFSWTSRVGRAEENAARYYRSCEGLGRFNSVVCHGLPLFEQIRSRRISHC
jgi:Bacterial protein of unknown function (DUF839)